MEGLETLDAYLLGASKAWRRNTFVSYPGFTEVYVRYTRRVLDGKIRSPVLDLARLEAAHPGQGAFTRMFNHLREKYPEMWLYVECVLNKRFEDRLKLMGFTQADQALAPSFYMKPAHEPVLAAWDM
jgi:hypothetical protein